MPQPPIRFAPLLDGYYRLCEVSLVTGELDEVTTRQNVSDDEPPNRYPGSNLYDACRGSIQDEIR